MAPLSFCNVLLHTGVHGLTGLMLSSNMLHVQILIERFNCTCTIQVCPMAKSLGRGSTVLRSSTKTLSTVLQRCPPVHVSIIKEPYATISHVPHRDCSQKRVPLSTSNPYSERFTNTQCLHVKQHPGESQGKASWTVHRHPARPFDCPPQGDSSSIPFPLHPEYMRLEKQSMGVPKVIKGALGGQARGQFRWWFQTEASGG